MASVPNSGSANPPPPPPVWDAQPRQDGTVRYAGFWLRVVAAIIDGIILIVVTQIIALFFPMPVTITEMVDWQTVIENIQASMPTGLVAVSSLVVWAYFAFQESSSARATLGKRALGIRVSTADGAQLGLGMATLRAWPIYLPNAAWLVGAGLSWIVWLAAIIACLAVAFSARKQGLHDKMAGAVLTRQ
ncbi:MAG: RDD family protein [Alphaproteobacteria bacterium]|nr:RDD family protein [Alphaproteobacteria bacterium]